MAIKKNSVDLQKIGKRLAEIKILKDCLEVEDKILKTQILDLIVPKEPYVIHGIVDEKGNMFQINKIHSETPVVKPETLYDKMEDIENFLSCVKCVNEQLKKFFGEFEIKAMAAKTEIKEYLSITVAKGI